MTAILLAAYAAALIVYGNAVSHVAGSAVAPGVTGVASGATLTAAALLGARAARIPFRDIGLTRERLGSAAVFGMCIALIAAAGALVILEFPPILGGPVTYAPLASLTATDLAMRVALAMPIDTVIPEEVAFRGLLLTLLVQRYGVRAGVLLSAAIFTAWHAVILDATVAQTSLAGDPLFSALARCAAAGAIFAGGVLFAALRLATRSLVAPLVAHWGFNSALLLGLSLR